MAQNLEVKEVLLRFIFLIEEATGDSVPQQALWELICMIRRDGFLGLGSLGRFSVSTMDGWFTQALDALMVGGCLDASDRGRLALTQVGSIAAKGITLPEPLLCYEHQILA